MTTVRLLPAHEIVQRTFPRPPPTEQDHVAMASGKAIDTALAWMGHQVRLGRKPTGSAAWREAEEQLQEALDEAGAEISAGDREKFRLQVHAVAAAYRSSPLYGLARPKTRILMINNRVGVYAQPDFWDSRTQIFEMKTYPAIPPPPDVQLQLRLFQLAFPTFEMILVCFNRHASPVVGATMRANPPSPEERGATLRLAYTLGRTEGEEKVLEYVEGPFTYYEIPDSDPAAAENSP